MGYDLERAENAAIDRAVDIDCQMMRSDEELVVDCAQARLKLIRGICMSFYQGKTLTKKQRYCLARWIVDRDDEYEL